ncbi:putative vacuolar membrane transporter for cationic amino acids [Dipsacomyces acuminosporus]|nr:putative vacuolar membrane transporter for cationic amino acids [Dipsacomyces acuminosporus]
MSAPANAQGGINQTASDIIGYISLVCWIVVMFPQIYLNYKRKSGEGVSLMMMIAWVIGDILNIAGAVMQGLVMSTILIGSYYLFVDGTLLSQTIYYRIFYKAHLSKKNINESDEENAEAADSNSDSAEDDSSASLIASNRQANDQYQTVSTEVNTALLSDAQGSNSDGSDDTTDHVALTSPPSSPSQPRWHERHHLDEVLALLLSLVSMACLVVTIVALTLGHTMSGGGDKSPKQPSPKEPIPTSQIVAQIMGTISAIVYTMSYVAQAIKNYQRKSCEGLSMWLFILSLLGNTTYALAILVVSLDPHYLAPYVPWLLGALIPCVVHFVILYQFKMYSTN